MELILFLFIIGIRTWFAYIFLVVAISKLIPEMEVCVDNLKRNRVHWMTKLHDMGLTLSIKPGMPRML